MSVSDSLIVNIFFDYLETVPIFWGNYFYVGRVNFGTEFLTTRCFLTQPDFFTGTFCRCLTSTLQYSKPLLKTFTRSSVRT